MTPRALAPALAVLALPAAALAQTPPAADAYGAPPPVVAAPPPPPPVMAGADTGEGLGAVPQARHAIYLGATSLILLNSVGLNYSYRPFRGFAVSVGAGLSAAFAGFGSVSAVGGQMMAHGLFGGAGSHSFELAGGLSVVSTTSTIFCGSCDETTRLAALPSAFLGYRFHPMNGGFLFRAGAAWEFGLGVGAHLSFGGAF
ncbi:MAG: hypothetical protein U0325_14685 [Polyangiales bacterium]